jgi:hypothetical protein
MHGECNRAGIDVKYRQPRGGPYAVCGNAAAGRAYPVNRRDER